MKFRVEVICLHEDSEQRCCVMEMERTELAMDTLGLSVAEGKTMLQDVQEFVASQQTQEDLKERATVRPAASRATAKTRAPTR